MDACAINVDDLLDLPNDDFSVSDVLHHPSSPANAHFQQSSIPSYSTDFADIFRLPTEDAAELEWLSNYMDDSFTDFPAAELTGVSDSMNGARSPMKAESSASAEVARRCTHCASEKTPQWRTGPLGPKTLCNACGVRFKSGRLVPEYRPAASPTFVLTQHSNSHRKVLELRRQKDQLRQQQQQQEAYGRHFRVC